VSQPDVRVSTAAPISVFLDGIAHDAVLLSGQVRGPEFHGKYRL